MGKVDKSGEKLEKVWKGPPPLEKLGKVAISVKRGEKWLGRGYLWLYVAKSGFMRLKVVKSG